MIFSNCGVRNEAVIRSLGLIIAICLNSFPCQAEQTLLVKETKESFYKFEHPPAFEDSISPIYPRMALRAQMEGTVVIKTIVGPNGQLMDVEVVNGVNPMLNRAAINALRESSFTPATVGGKAVTGDLTVSYLFDFNLWCRENLRKERPPIDMQSPLISEVGKLVEKGNGHPDCNVYSYDNVRFYGDISIKTYENALEQVRPYFADGEMIFAINHFLSYGELDEMDMMGTFDLVILTCEGQKLEGDCIGGNLYNFVNLNGVYTLEFENEFRKTWLH